MTKRTWIGDLDRLVTTKFDPAVLTVVRTGDFWMIHDEFGPFKGPFATAALARTTIESYKRMI